MTYNTDFAMSVFPDEEDKILLEFPCLHLVLIVTIEQFRHFKVTEEELPDGDYLYKVFVDDELILQRMQFGPHKNFQEVVTRIEQCKNRLKDK